MHLIPIALIGAFILSSSVAAPIPTEADQIIPGSSQQVSTTAALSLPQAPKAEAAPVRSHTDAQSAYSVHLTAYNAVPSQTDSNPGVTASGARSNPEVIAARSRDLAGSMPFGTVIAIERTAIDTPRCQFAKVEHLIGYRVIADTTNARFTERLDVELPIDATIPLYGIGQVSAARVLGVCDRVSVRVVGKVDVNNMPATQSELVRIIEGTELARL